MIEIRNARFNDLAEIVNLESKIWPEGTRASKEKFESRLNIFPEGFFVAFKNGVMIGVSTSEMIGYSNDHLPSSWETITNDGWIGKTHNPNGNALYIVSIGAISRSGGGSALIQAQKDLAKKLNLKLLLLGARIPGYDDHCKEKGEINVNDYTNLKRSNNELLDPELRFYIRNGLEIVKVQANYMEEDKESRNYGAIMLWKNE